MSGAGGSVWKQSHQNIFCLAHCQLLCQNNPNCHWMVWKSGANAGGKFVCTLNGLGAESFTTNSHGRYFGPKFCP